MTTMKQNSPIKNILAVKPTYFDVEYEINPFMRDSNGQLQKIDKIKAFDQWESLKKTYIKLGLVFHEVAPSKDHPDMVFTANQMFPFINNLGEQSFILSHMATPERAGEVLFFKKWAQSLNFKTYQISVGPFEGMGDALWSYDNRKVFLGFGFRTHPDAAEQLQKLTGKEIVRLMLINPNFYHLDTCLSILNDDTCAFVKEAFDHESLSKIKSHFKNCIELSAKESKDGLACNLFCPDGENIIIEQTNINTISRLADQKFKVHPVDTSEFIKSGGSVFCLKLAF